MIFTWRGVRSWCACILPLPLISTSSSLAHGCADLANDQNIALFDTRIVVRFHECERQDAGIRKILGVNAGDGPGEQSSRGGTNAFPSREFVEEFSVPSTGTVKETASEGFFRNLFDQPEINLLYSQV